MIKGDYQGLIRRIKEIENSGSFIKAKMPVKERREKISQIFLDIAEISLGVRQHNLAHVVSLPTIMEGLILRGFAVFGDIQDAYDFAEAYKIITETHIPSYVCPNEDVQYAVQWERKF